MSIGDMYTYIYHLLSASGVCFKVSYNSNIRILEYKSSHGNTTYETKIVFNSTTGVIDLYKTVIPYLPKLININVTFESEE